MKKPYLWLVLFIGFGCTSDHQSPKSVKLENSLLWEISGNGLTSPSYLFGTYHLIGSRFLNSLPVVHEKFLKCKAVAEEIIIDTAELHKFNPIFLLKNDSLTNVFTHSEFSDISNALNKYAHRDLSKLKKLKPACIELILMFAIAPSTLTPDNPSIDEYFQEEGKKSGFKIIGLESVTFHNELLFNQPIEVQKRHLLFAVAQMEQARKNIKAYYDLYHQQDLNGTDHLMLKDKEYTREEMDQLVKDRNQKWLDELPDIIKQRPTFIAVGLGHLLWDTGLINQLRLKGYTVKPVMN